MIQQLCYCGGREWGDKKTNCGILKASNTKHENLHFPHCYSTSCIIQAMHYRLAGLPFNYLKDRIYYVRFNIQQYPDSHSNLYIQLKYAITTAALFHNYVWMLLIALSMNRIPSFLWQQSSFVERMWDYFTGI